jgi:DNA helicase-2/ATP-dependent DNA helicase PcrA
VDSTSPAELNEGQARAAAHGDGPLLIVAGAGSGKTQTLAHRVATLIGRGTAAERILLVTFSRRAAAAMTRRVAHLVDQDSAARLQAGTFHAIANHLLRHYGAALGMPGSFTVLDQADSAELMGLVRAEVLSSPSRRFPRQDTLVAIYSRVVNSSVPLTEILPTAFPWCRAEAEMIARIFAGYTERKRDQNLLDFDDLLLYLRAALDDELAGSVLRQLYDHILVDEYQDTNTVQADIVKALAATAHGVTVVGDDAQAIYSFRSATIRNILDFPVVFPGATTVVLEQNYRSTQPILDLANGVMERSPQALAKRLWSDEPFGPRPVLAVCPDGATQTDAVCDNILELYESGVALRDQAVLFRASHNSDTLEVELARRNIPFVKYGGLRFLDSSHVRDLLALLRILDNPWDELAWQRVLLLLDGIGPTTARRLIGRLGVRPRVDNPPNPLDHFCHDPGDLFPRPSASRTGLMTALADCADDGLSAGAQVDRLRLALDPMIKTRYERAEIRLRDLDQLGQLAGGYPSRARLVSELTLDPPQSTGDLAGPPGLDEDWLTLSTVHSAKGGEWTAVHLIHAADGVFPSDMATGDTDSIEEERRLFYVALTRARTNLHIYAPLRYHHGRAFSSGDAHSYAQRTRFLPSELDSLLDIRAVRSRGQDEGPAVAGLPGALSPQRMNLAVGRALGGLW